MTAPTPPAPPTPPKIAWGRNNALFKSELSKGFKYQRVVADFLLAHDVDVQMPRMRVRKSIASAHQFLNEPDLIAAGKVLEVKSRALEFYRAMELPSTTPIDTTDGYDAKDPKPFAYIIVSQVTGAMCWCDGTDKSKWSVVKTHDRKRGIDVVCYAARRLQFAGMPSLIAALRGTDAPK